MVVCQICGEECNNITYQFCANCGSRLNVVLPKDMVRIQSETKQHIKMQQRASILVQRNVIIWGLLCFFISFVYPIYLYYNFEDMRILMANDDNEGSHVLDSNHSLIITLAILSVFFSPIKVVLRYMKTKRLHQYFENCPAKQEYKPPNYKLQLAIGILSQLITYSSSAFSYIASRHLYTGGVPDYDSIMIYGYISIGIGLLNVLVCGIYIYYSEYKWQKAYNERVLMINPYAVEKFF